MRNGLARFSLFIPGYHLRRCIFRTLITALALALLCMTLGFAAAKGWAAGNPDSKASAAAEAFKPSQEDLAGLTPLLVSAVRFRTVARTDYEKALLAFSRDKGRHKLWAIDKGFWAPEQSQWAWNIYFSSAVHILGGRRGDSGIVGFYNPYCDAFLLTVWAPSGSGYSLVDAEMVMGDWVRIDNAALDPVPLWLREKIHRPAALGLAVAESILAFERVFDGVSRDKWRSALPILQNDDALYDLNYPALAVILNQHLINVGAIADPTSKESALTACRELAQQLLEQASQGNIGPGLAKAVNTLPETAATLKALKPEWFKSLRVSGVLTDPGGTLIFLTSRDQTSAGLSLFFGGGPKEYRLQRVDLIDFQYFYNQLKFARHGAKATKGGRQ
jgi:hypothetical protein